ncbi:MAG: tRNA (adenosine(37)-N6)-threonylcarbamoyltransferase complex transferase subunit TsaD, partial [Planctomycetes bacterium]|nr:tRNA (adenosine(37)-N6)-threonylcarbamoyltransferase complex transferase subunit TsaD [Planctomycetota bacterium]
MAKAINILGIETSCDETAAAIVTDGRDIRSSVVALQVELHARFGGVVPELASRGHMEAIYPVVSQALEQAGMETGDIDAVAIANQPGLTVALMVGVTAAKTLAFALDKPLIAINHIHAHL